MITTDTLTIISAIGICIVLILQRVALHDKQSLITVLNKLIDTQRACLANDRHELYKAWKIIYKDVPNAVETIEDWYSTLTLVEQASSIEELESYKGKVREVVKRMEVIIK